MILKPANKYQIIWQCHNFKHVFITNFHHHTFSLTSKRFVNITFCRAENNKLKRQDN